MNNDMVTLEQIIRSNIYSLLKESDLLYKHKFLSRSIFLLIIAMEEAGRILLINDSGNNYENNHYAKLVKFSEWIVNTIPDEELIKDFVESLITNNNVIIKEFKKYFPRKPLEIIELLNPLSLEKQEIRNQLKISFSQIARIKVFLRPKFLYVDVEDNNNDLIINFLPFVNSKDGLESIRKFYRDNVSEFLISGN